MSWGELAVWILRFLQVARKLGYPQVAYTHDYIQAAYRLVRMQDTHKRDHPRVAGWPGRLWEACKLGCQPVDREVDLGEQQEEAGVESWGQSVYCRRALGRLRYDDMRVVHGQAVRSWASFEPGGLLLDSYQADGT